MSRPCFGMLALPGALPGLVRLHDGRTGARLNRRRAWSGREAGLAPPSRHQAPVRRPRSAIRRRRLSELIGASQTDRLRSCFGHALMRPRRLEVGAVGPGDCSQRQRHLLEVTGSRNAASIPGFVGEFRAETSTVPSRSSLKVTASRNPGDAEIGLIRHGAADCRQSIQALVMSGFMLGIRGVKMWRRMLAPGHLNHDSE